MVEGKILKMGRNQIKKRNGYIAVRENIKWVWFDSGRETGTTWSGR